MSGWRVLQHLVVVWRKFQHVRDVNISSAFRPFSPHSNAENATSCQPASQSANKMAETCCCRRWLENQSPARRLLRGRRHVLNHELWECIFKRNFKLFYCHGEWWRAELRCILIVENFRTRFISWQPVHVPCLAAQKDAGHTQCDFVFNTLDSTRLDSSCIDRRDKQGSQPVWSCRSSLLLGLGPAASYWGWCCAQEKLKTKYELWFHPWNMQFLYNLWIL